MSTHPDEPWIKTRQFAHQRRDYVRFRDDKYFALLWEMGLGKSKTALDIGAYLYEMGMIDQIVILAPNHVYENWVDHEVPTHLGVPHASMPYPRDIHSARDDMAKELWLDARRFRDRLRVLGVSYDSLCTDHGAEFAVAACRAWRTFLVVDESTKVKTHRAKRTRRTMTLARLAHVRCILTGTPVAQSPFDAHSQYKVLDVDFWRAHDVHHFSAFKAEFGIWGKVNMSGKLCDVVTGYKRLDQLHAMIAPVSSRLLKEDSEVELPPKLYATRKFALTRDQRQVYERLRLEYVAELDGAYVEAPLAMVRLMKLLQVTSGFVVGAENYEATFDPEPDYRPRRLLADDKNPRLALLHEILDECSHKVIVWCRFKWEVDLVCSTVKGCERYDGSVSQGARKTALDRFRDESNTRSRVLVANLKAMAYGVTVTIAKTMVYFSNDFSLELRLQSEDRFHRIGQDRPVYIIDLVAENTVDEKVIAALRSKFDIAAQTTGDRIRDWISGG